MSSNVDEAPKYTSYVDAPNVQELVKDNPSHVPNGYIRKEHEMPKNTNVALVSTHQIPVLDLSLLVDNNVEELKKLDHACIDYGFFQVINHGVPNEVLHKMKEVTRGFFNLSLEERNKFSTTDDIQGYGHTYVFSEEQILDWSDSLTLITVPKKFRKLQFWPTTPTEFHDALDAYSNGVTNVAEQLIGLISLNLGLEHSTLLDDHKGLWHGFRVNYYPPCSNPNEVLGISPHADTDTITVLLQDDDISALQIRHGDEWVPIKPIPNALVVNLGDVLEIWSNGKYKSIEHRAVTHESKSRISLVSFIFPSDEAEVEPYDSIVESQGSVRKYKKVNYGEFLRGSMQIKLEGKVGIETAKIY